MIGALVLFVHVISAMGMFAALGFEGALLAQLGRASSPAQVQSGLNAFRWVRLIGGPSLAGAVLSGAYRASTMSGWAGSLLAMAGVIAVGILAGLPGYRRREAKS